MRVIYDTNVLLDIFQNRKPHYDASAFAINASLEGIVTGVFPAHAVATVDYILRKYADQETASAAVAWLLDILEIAPCDESVLKQAAGSDFKDFEDAIVAFSAQQNSCECIVTRNVGDFASSPVPALSPEAFLKKYV